MHGVGEKFPIFNMQAIVNLDQGKDFPPVDYDSYPKKWRIYFFWSTDFSLICPTELAAFSTLNGDFAAHDAHVLAISIASKQVHRAWRDHHVDPDR